MSNILKAQYGLLVLVCFASLKAQILKPAEWHFKVYDNTIQIGQEVELIFEVTLDETWYVYSSDFIPTQSFGPVPTKFNFIPHSSYELIGDIISLNSKEKTDNLLDLTFRYMDESPVIFKQRIKVLSRNPIIRGTYEYQVCTMVDGKCIPGDGEFQFNIKTK